MTKINLPGTLDDSVREAEQGRQFDGSTTVKIGNAKYDSAIFSLKRADKSIVLDYLPAHPIGHVVGHLSKWNNWAMNDDNDKGQTYLGDPELEAKLATLHIPKSSTFPIERGDIVKIAVTGYRYFDENNKLVAKVLTWNYNQVEVPLYEITQKEGSSKLGARSWFFHEEIRKVMEPKQPKLIGEFIGVKYFDKKGNKLQAPYLQRKGKQIPLTKIKKMKISVQVEQHTKYSDKKGQKELSENDIYHQIDPSKLSQNVDEQVELLWGLGEELRRNGDTKALEKRRQIEKQKRISAQFRFDP